jgi:hypothetical protein
MSTLCHKSERNYFVKRSQNHEEDNIYVFVVAFCLYVPEVNVLQ